MKALLLSLLLLVAPQDGHGLLDKALWGCKDLERLEQVEALLDKYRVRSKLPLRCPLKDAFRISSPYGSRVHPITGRRRFHAGVDLAVEVATPVYATADGTVAFAGRRGGYGRCIVLEHDYGFSTLYGHLIAYYVRQDDVVRAGQPIGFVGSTGRSTGNHLHYECRKDNRPIKPYWSL